MSFLALLTERGETLNIEAALSRALPSSECGNFATLCWFRPLFTDARNLPFSTCRFFASTAKYSTHLAATAARRNSSRSELILTTLHARKTKPVPSHANKPLPRKHLHMPIREPPAPHSTLRCLNEHVQTFTRQRHLREQHALPNVPQNLLSPRLQHPTNKRMVEVIAAQAATKHHAETITNRRTPNRAPRTPRQRISRGSESRTISTQRTLPHSTNPTTIHTKRIPRTTRQALTAPLPTRLRHTTARTSPLKLAPTHATNQHAKSLPEQQRENKP